MHDSILSRSHFKCKALYLSDGVFASGGVDGRLPAWLSAAVSRSDRQRCSGWQCENGQTKDTNGTEGRTTGNRDDREKEEGYFLRFLLLIIVSLTCLTMILMVMPTVVTIFVLVRFRYVEYLNLMIHSMNIIIC